MPLITYKDMNFRPATLRVIEHANDIINAYAAQGLTLTLRQLYYQFVSRDLIPNNLREYKKLGDIIGNARQAGMIDWNAIVDRTRNLQGTQFWRDPAHIMAAVAGSYITDRWANQEFHVEVWVEKEALVDVIGRAARTRDLNYFACKGYTSESAMWQAARRLIRREQAGQGTVVLHLGDHDPSGIDMTRDIQDRLRGFGAHTEVERLALNMDQVDAYSPPPNPAKMTDSRAEGYVELYGYESWELDALDPATLNQVIVDAVEPYLDLEQWETDTVAMNLQREALQKVERNWAAVEEFVANLDE